MKIIQMVVCFPLALIRLIFLFFITAILEVIGGAWYLFFGFSINLQRVVMRTWGEAVLFICGIKINRNEIPLRDHFIIMANHRSYLDIFILAALMPAAFVGKAELRKWPFLKIGAKLTNLIFVNRSEMRSSIRAMKKIKNTILRGIPVILFPEATTYKGPYTKRFKNGCFKIAAELESIVIPVAINYNDVDDAWVDDDKFITHFFRQMGKLFTYVDVCFGSDICNKNYKQLQLDAKEQIDNMLFNILHK